MHLSRALALCLFFGTIGCAHEKRAVPTSAPAEKEQAVDKKGDQIPPATAPAPAPFDPATWDPVDLADAQRRSDEAFDVCHHWGGEEPYDDDRREEIAAGYKRDCPVAVIILQKAWASHADDPLMAAIAIDAVGYLGTEFDAEKNLLPTDAAKENACQLASDLYMNEKRDEAYARSICPRR